MDGRKCSKCGVVKDADQFIPRRGDKSIPTRMCKKCRERECGYQKKRMENPEVVLDNRKRAREYDKRMRPDPKWVEKERERKFEYRQRMKDSATAKKARKTKNVKAKKRYANDPVFRLGKQMGSAIYRALAGRKKWRKWEQLVGYTCEDLVAHMVSLFEDGMTLENYGEWHIDHRKPVSWFNYETAKDQEFKECWSLENLKPMWASENCSKGNRYED